MTSFDTEQMLILRYGFKPMIPLDDVAADYLSDAKPEWYRRQAIDGNLPFPVVVSGKGKATTYHVPVKALASWIDRVSAEAIKDHHAMQA